MHSLRTKILSLALVFLVFLSTAFVLYSITTTKNYKLLRLDGIEKSVAFETEKVNKKIAEIECGAMSIAIDGFLCVKSQSDKIAELSALEYLYSFPEVIGVGFWFEPYAYNEVSHRAGIYAFLNKETNEIFLDNTFSINEYDYHNLNWYREIIDEIKAPHQVVWTKPYVDDAPLLSYMTTAGAGIYNEQGSLLGISTVDWEIEDVINDLSAVKPTKNSIVLLCVPEKDYIISSTYTNNDSPQLTPGAGSSIKDLPWDINAASFVLDGMTYIPFVRTMNNGWLMSVQIPENEIFAEIESENNRFSILIAASSAIMLFFAYLLVSKLINAPITQLTNDVSQLALGNLDMHINAIRKDELGLLAQTFNKMTSDLKESIDAYTREHVEKERIAAELNAAAEIQFSMLPRVFPPFPGRKEFDLFASMVPARVVGGDFYDFFLVDKNTLAFIIGDVAGKGMPAALFMVNVISLIKNISHCRNNTCCGISPKNIFETVNNLLCANNEKNMFATAFIGYYNITNGKLIFVNAGHNPPLIINKNKKAEFLKVRPCMALGCFENVEYKEEEITLEPGDLLYLYTDGVTEAMNSRRDFFSEDRLVNAMNSNNNSPPEELISVMKQEIKSFAGDFEQADDITQLAVKINHYTKEMEELEIEASMNNLYEVIDFINLELDSIDCPPDLETQLNLVTEEIFTNIVKYAYPRTGGNAVIGIKTGEEIKLKFEDEGIPFNPLEIPAPNLWNAPEDREIGGLGIHLVRQLMDKVEYLRDGNKNILTMTKRIG